MSMGGGNPAIEISVTARIDQLERGLKSAQAKVEQSVAPMGQAGERAGSSYMSKLSGALMKATGVLAVTGLVSNLFKAAGQEIGAGGSMQDIDRAMGKAFKQSLASLPVIGGFLEGFDLMLNGAQYAAEERSKQFGESIASSLAAAISRRDVVGDALSEGGRKRARARAELAGQFEGPAGDLERERFDIKQDAERQMSELEERYNKETALLNELKQKHREIGVQTDAQLAALKEQEAVHEANLSLMQFQRADIVQAEMDQLALAEKRAQKITEEADERERIKAAAEATLAAEKQTKALADAAKASKESVIKGLQQTGKARENAIAAQIAALQGQSPAARSASIGALTQQFAGNMGGSIQTALGTFRSGGSAVAERAYQEAKAQTEKQEKIVKLQEEMKQVQVDIRAKIDAMKGAA